MKVPFLNLEKQSSPLWSAAAQRVIGKRPVYDGPELAAFEIALPLTVEPPNVPEPRTERILWNSPSGRPASPQVMRSRPSVMLVCTPHGHPCDWRDPLYIDIDDRTLLMCSASLKAVVETPQKPSSSRTSMAPWFR